MYFGEINLGIRVWFGRRVRQSLENIRDFKENSWETRHGLADPETFEWVAEWYCENIVRFIRGDAKNTFCVDDIHNDERVMFDREAVCDAIRGVLDRATVALERLKEAKRYETLDAWLEALHTDRLTWSGPAEEHGESFVVDYTAFLARARKRRVRWPRVCRTCGDEFRVEKGNAKNCENCRAKQRAARA